MSLEIRLLGDEDIAECERIYAEARAFMRESGNATQWSGGYPGREVLLDDVAKKRLYGVFDGERQIGVFCFFIGVDPTYVRIYEGEWLTGGEYGVIHRIAVSRDAHGKGVAHLCFGFAEARAKSVRIDTHRDNIPMQRSLAKYGFKRCGIIYLQSGDERIAYEKCK